MSEKISFIGLGNMGFPMAKNLLKNGANLQVYNRTKEKAEPLIKSGANYLESPKDAFKESSIVFTMVANDEALLDIAEGPNSILTNAGLGAIHVSCSTVDPATIEKLAKSHKEKGVTLISAPVFGRPDVAEKQSLWICIAGNPEGKKRVEPFLKMMGQKIYDFGDKPESANNVKVTGNFLILAVSELLAEAFTVLDRNQVNPGSFLELITDSIFPSPVFKTYGKIILDEKFSPPGFKLPLGLKDINLFLKAAEKVQSNPPVGKLLQERLKKSIEKGREELDWSAISLLSKEENK